MASRDERIAKVGFAHLNAISRPELGSVFGLIIIIITFMILTSLRSELSLLCGLDL